MLESRRYASKSRQGGFQRFDDFLRASNLRWRQFVQIVEAIGP